MPLQDQQLKIALASSEADLLGAQRLRYEIFVEELGGDGELVDHARRLERDRFDPFYDHLVLIDTSRSEADLSHVVGVYRLLRSAQAEALGQYYTEGEYDISVLRNSGRQLLELGRSCVHKDYRGTMAMFHLWSGLANYVDQHGIEVLFGVASFHGTDVQALAQPLSFLHHHHLAPPELRVRSLQFQTMDLVPPEAFSRPEAMKATPALIKAYLRLGGFVGEGAYVDHAFNTTDVCLVMDTERMSAQARARYGRPPT